ncbi:hypothetical protein LZ30DRAFT_398459 [Colletotrichum cereale]|nr:hypothetical protein LZ30DRAFT_398459 [Colletotrichum cereale]
MPPSVTPSIVHPAYLHYSMWYFLLRTDAPLSSGGLRSKVPERLVIAGTRRRRVLEGCCTWGPGKNKTGSATFRRSRQDTSKTDLRQRWRCCPTPGSADDLRRPHTREAAQRKPKRRRENLPLNRRVLSLPIRQGAHRRSLYPQGGEGDHTGASFRTSAS